MNLVRMKKDDRFADVHPLEVQNYRSGGWMMVEAEAPSNGIGTDSGEQFLDAQLRDAIRTATGKAPGPNTSRETLIGRFNELNAKV